MPIAADWSPELAEAGSAQRGGEPGWVQLNDSGRPDFHQDNGDTTQLVETWRTNFFGEDGTVIDELIGAAF